MTDYNNKNYFIDKNKGVDIIYKNDELLHETQSKFQNIKVFKNKLFDKILVIDNDLQLTDFDEHNYHEMLVHIPLNYLPKASNVLIIGGGDGGTAREVLKHTNIKNIDQVDIDIEVINVCKKYFPALSISYEDPRLNLIIADGSAWVDNNLKKKKKYYDVILVDSTDYSTAISLFSHEFYNKLSKMLTKYGIMVFNNMSVPWEVKEFKSTKKNLEKIYKFASPFQVFQPSYSSGHYSFMFCSNKIDPKNYAINWQIWKEKNIICKYYNQNIHDMSFSLPTFAIRDIVETKRLGSHFLIDADGIKFDLLNDIQILINMCKLIIEIYKLTIIDMRYNQFNPQGISIIFLLSESHLSLHTWPENGKISIDLFSCKDFQYNIIIDSYKINILSIIKHYLKPDKINLKSIEREI